MSEEGDKFSQPLEESKEARLEGEIHAADEEHKHYPLTLDADEEEEKEEEGPETLSSLVSAIEQQSAYIKELIQEIKNLRVELLDKGSQPHFNPSRKKDKKPSEKAGKKRMRSKRQSG